jgi:hypothetical protein
LLVCKSPGGCGLETRGGQICVWHLFRQVRQQRCSALRGSAVCGATRNPRGETRKARTPNAMRKPQVWGRQHRARASKDFIAYFQSLCSQLEQHKLDVDDIDLTIIYSLCTLQNCNWVCVCQDLVEQEWYPPLLALQHFLDMCLESQLIISDFSVPRVAR